MPRRVIQYGLDTSVNHVGDNVRKLLPSLALGIFITVLAALFNYFIYERRLPAMAVGNPIFRESAEGKSHRRLQTTPLRVLAGLVNLSDDLVTDIMYAIRGPGDFKSTADRIAVVSIDEDSLLRHGSWPWPRDEVAKLLAKLSDAKVVGIDMIFSEPDRLSMANYVGDFEKLFNVALDREKVGTDLLDNDRLLARQISQTPTVLGALFHDRDVGEKCASGLIANYRLATRTQNGKAVSYHDALLKMSKKVTTCIPIIREIDPPPPGEGFINLFPAPNGIVRNVPLLAHVADSAFSESEGTLRRIYPSLVLELIRVAYGGDFYDVVLRGNVVNIPEFADADNKGDRYPLKGVSIRKGGAGGEALIHIPLNELGEIGIGYRNPENDYKYYSAWEVLDGRHDGAFKDKLVLLGGTVEGVGYMVSTGLPAPELSVAEAHAFALANILRGDFMDGGYHDDYSWQQATILASGLAVTLGIIFGSLGAGMIISGLGLLFVALGNYFLFFHYGRNVGMTLPLLSILAILLVQMVVNYLLVGRERRFIRKAFQLNVSPSILSYLESHPDRLSSLQGEHRNMSALFTDIRGFTSISERMTAPDLARFLNEYFTPMSDIVMKNMGTVDKFIGDGLMAFWNAPADNQHHPRDAAKSALDMLEKLAELQAGWTSRGLPKVSIGCGINTGAMFAGYMGSEQRKNYTVMGDNVNIASRLEGLNKVYASNILITETTRNELGKDFTCRVVDKVRVSGKDKAVVIYELLGAGYSSDEEMEETAAFGRVFELYQMREFAAAESLLKELVFIRPAPLYKMYLDRLAIYKALPPPPDWDGTFSMAYK